MRIRIVLGTLLSVSAVVGSAHGQMMPLEDRREFQAHATHSGSTESLTDAPAAPFAYFDSFLAPFVKAEVGSAEAATHQVSEFFPAGIHASGSTSGYWTIAPGTYGALSRAAFKFRVASCLEYTLHVWVDPADFAGGCDFSLRASPAPVAYHLVDSGELHMTGRIPAGDYTIEGASSFTTGLENYYGGTYSYVWTCSTCQSQLIRDQPADTLLACGSTAVFTVVPTSPGPGLTYQWRRNGTPLADGGRVSGAGTPSLSIQNACDPDTGWYDVLVSDGTVIEASRIAQLRTSGTSGVEPGPRAAGRAVLEAGGPNPFIGRTSLRYATSRPGTVRLSLHDLTGARIRTLVQGFADAHGVIEWDGRTESGSRAPAGIYFARLEAGSERASLRVVRLR